MITIIMRLTLKEKIQVCHLMLEQIKRVIVQSDCCLPCVCNREPIGFDLTLMFTSFHSIKAIETENELHGFQFEDIMVSFSEYCRLCAHQILNVCNMCLQIFLNYVTDNEECMHGLTISVVTLFSEPVCSGSSVCV